MQFQSDIAGLVAPGQRAVFRYTDRAERLPDDREVITAAGMLEAKVGALIIVEREMDAELR